MSTIRLPIVPLPSSCPHGTSEFAEFYMPSMLTLPVIPGLRSTIPGFPEKASPRRFFDLEMGRLFGYTGRFFSTKSFNDMKPLKPNISDQGRFFGKKPVVNVSNAVA